jgi:pimeloyl-ACP methyl ester carboxylesterase
MTPDEQMATLAGGRLAYWDVGPAFPAPTLLLVHGWAGDKAVWLETIERLGVDYRCVAMDLPGHGAAADAAADHSPRAQAEIVAQLADHLGLSKTTAIGHSLGTWAVLHLAQIRPDLVATAVLCNPPHPAHGVWSGRVVRRVRMAAPTLSAMRRWQALVGQFAPDSGGGSLGAALRRSRATTYVSVPVLNATLDAIFDHGLDERSWQLPTPTLVVAGRLDITAPPAGARAVAARLPDARLVTFARASHHPMLEQPDEFVALLRQWTAEQGVTVPVAGSRAALV